MIPWLVTVAWTASSVWLVDQAQIHVHMDQDGPRISRYMTGACIEDVNHEIYGGLYSQMVFGESFQEPAITLPPQGFTAYGGAWVVKKDELHFTGTAGDKLIHEMTPLADGQIGMEIFLPTQEAYGGLVFYVTHPGMGPDNFVGYEVALCGANRCVRLSRHQHNWALIKDVPYELPVGKWIPLEVHMAGSVIQVAVDGKLILQHDDGAATLEAGAVGIRVYHHEGRFRNLWVQPSGQERRLLKFESAAIDIPKISGMWREVRRGNVTGHCTIETDRPFVGNQYQRITLTAGSGELGIENQGLNRWGMNFVADRPYEGLLCARTMSENTLSIAMESRDGKQVYAETSAVVKAGNWQRITFALTPDTADKTGRLAIKLKQPGTVDLGYVSLQPGEWGRYKGLPLRRDVVEALIDQGITILRYGGSMILADDYRWKKMIGPREQRSPYKGFWYPYATHGWGILDFLNFCEAAGFLGIPNLNVDETTQDFADFVQYVNGSADSTWGRRRVQDGHPEPYHLKYIQIGNEPNFNTDYVAKVKRAIEALWAADPNVIVIVSDSNFEQPLTEARNPDLFAAHRDLLALAKARNREVWFDTHLWADLPKAVNTDQIVPPLLEALAQTGPETKTRVAICELNAVTHHIGRAIANAIFIGQLEQLGEERVPLVTSANCLQPDGQNDNGWDQGLLFLNPAQVWLQPPGYVTRMIARNYQPISVPIQVDGPSSLKAFAVRSEDGKTLVLRVVNEGDQACAATLRLDGFTPTKPTAALEELSGPVEATNTVDDPRRITPRSESWTHGFSSGQTQRTFPANSFTVIRFE